MPPAEVGDVFMIDRNVGAHGVTSPVQPV